MSYLSVTSSKFNFADWFKETPLGIRLGAVAETIWALGTLQQLAAGDTLVRRGTAEPVLHVILLGRMLNTHTWYGPGNHLGAGAILRGQTVVDDVIASEPCTVWTLRMDNGASAAMPAPMRGLLLEVLAMLEPLPRNRPAPPRIVPDPEKLCDVDHPLVLRTAKSLKCSTDAQTAAAIWAYVQKMPYRFGAWQERASQTLARGTGMCTTKANVQVALSRACGLEAGYVEIGLEMSVLGLLIPDMWRYVMRPKVRHYFAAVKLGGRWHGADATFNVACLNLFAKANPVLEQLQPYRFGLNEPFNPAAFVNGEDPFDIDVRPDLVREMSKSSRFEKHHFDSLNTRLDRAQGLIDMPQSAAQDVPAMSAMAG